jgi:hydroxymethylbilane synthase
METTGDRDKISSLRTMGKTDFFTKEIDEALASSLCRIAIHSAKDLPEKLHPKLAIAAITRGLDPSDVLVVRQREAFGKSPLVATSSMRREEAVRELLGKDVQFCDVRGTIDERLALLDRREVDGVVIAEAALLRLGYSSRVRYKLPGATVPLQGQLTITIREDDDEMAKLFRCIDVR